MSSTSGRHQRWSCRRNSSTRGKLASKCSTADSRRGETRRSPLLKATRTRRASPPNRSRPKSLRNCFYRRPQSPATRTAPCALTSTASLQRCETPGRRISSTATPSAAPAKTITVTTMVQCATPNFVPWVDVERRKRANRSSCAATPIVARSCRSGESLTLSTMSVFAMRAAYTGVDSWAHLIRGNGDPSLSAIL